jgi:hypothetical protein
MVPPVYRAIPEGREALAVARERIRVLFAELFKQRAARRPRTRRLAGRM